MHLTGNGTFVAVGILLWLLGTSLSSPEGFLTAASIMDSFFVKFIMWGILTALAYHAARSPEHPAIPSHPALFSDVLMPEKTF
ncbi:hypothetical protein KAM622c_35660 [Klebsiella quasipneumoniae subsp. quasipneumoniae]|nr:hypothetical protein KAM622c_35660 [Klebsiella quasipneumoniae subsp. quasipneumoniae]